MTSVEYISVVIKHAASRHAVVLRSEHSPPHPLSASPPCHLVPLLLRVWWLLPLPSLPGGGEGGVGGEVGEGEARSFAGGEGGFEGEVGGWRRLERGFEGGEG